MSRAILYWLFALTGFLGWLGFLLYHYFAYSSTDPYLLSPSYQAAFRANRISLLFSELAFPLIMALFFLVLLLLKSFRRRIRPLGILAMVMSCEFFIYRVFIFSERYPDYQEATRMLDSGMAPEVNSLWPGLLVSGLILVFTLLVKEQVPLRPPRWVASTRIFAEHQDPNS